MKPIWILSTCVIAVMAVGMFGELPPVNAQLEQSYEEQTRTFREKAQGQYEQLLEQQALQALALQLRTQTDEARRKEIQQQIEQKLSAIFDQDLAVRQKELEQVKQRVADLESLFEKRKATKDDIVKLQMQTIVNEAQGLGFFSDPIGQSMSESMRRFYSRSNTLLPGGTPEAFDPTQPLRSQPDDAPVPDNFDSETVEEGEPEPAPNEQPGEGFEERQPQIPSSEDSSPDAIEEIPRPGKSTKPTV